MSILGPVAAIVLTGLAASDPVPGAYLEVNFAQGQAAGAGTPIEVLLMGNRTSSGVATVDTEVYGPETLIPLQTEADCINLFGAGSELHRMWRRFVKVNGDTTVRAIAITESAGTAASLAAVISTPAAANGNIRIFVHDEFVDVGVASGDAVDSIGAACAAAINNMTHWGVTAAYNSGTDTLTITAKQNGPRGNQIRVQVIVSPGVNTAFSTMTTDSPLAGGATADSNTTALATIATNRYYYIVSAAGDATQAGAAATQINLQATPTTGIRQRLIIGAVGTLGATTTIATGINAARTEVVWSEKSVWTEAELAANQAAVITKFETAPNPRTNFCNFGQSPDTQDYWLVPGPRVTTARPSRTSIKSALNNGISPVGVQTNGRTYLVNRITSRSLNGSVNDYRIRAAHKVTVCDFFGDDLLTKTVLQFSGKRIMNDPARGQRPPGGQVVTPVQYRGAIFRLLDDYDANDLLDDVQAIKSGTVVQRESSPTTRMTARIPMRVVDNAEQFAVALDQVA